jgi:hypothetical protein
MFFAESAELLFSPNPVKAAWSRRLWGTHTFYLRNLRNPWHLRYLWHLQLRSRVPPEVVGHSYHLLQIKLHGRNSTRCRGIHSRGATRVFWIASAAAMVEVSYRTPLTLQLDLGRAGGSSLPHSMQSGARRRRLQPLPVGCDLVRRRRDRIVTG